MSNLHEKGIASCATTKFFANRKYEQLIPQYGNIHILNAGYGEAVHKTTKVAYSHSNKHRDAMQDQASLETYNS